MLKEVAETTEADQVRHSPLQNVWENRPGNYCALFVSVESSRLSSKVWKAVISLTQDYCILSKRETNLALCKIWGSWGPRILHRWKHRSCYTVVPKIHFLMNKTWFLAMGVSWKPTVMPSLKEMKRKPVRMAWIWWNFTWRRAKLNWSKI